MSSRNCAMTSEVVGSLHESRQVTRDRTTKSVASQIVWEVEDGRSLELGTVPYWARAAMQREHGRRGKPART